MRGRAQGFAIAIAAALIGATAPASAAGFLEKNFYLSGPRYSADLPLCESHGPQHLIQSRFGTKEGRFWNSDLAITGFEKVQEVAFRPWAAAAIPRRFCKAVALVSDGVKRPIYYSIVEDGGLFGAAYGVEWCVVGLDRNWAYNPRCKMAAP
jgi:hypothetical protein